MIVETDIGNGVIRYCGGVYDKEGNVYIFVYSEQL